MTGCTHPHRTAMLPLVHAPLTPDAAMRAAIELAEQGMRGGHGGPFGCVIVQRGAIVGRGHNRVTSSNDPTAHAEIVAIRAACAALATFRLDDCELFTSCEPCPMCLAAIYWARIPRVWFANTRADAAASGFDDERLYRELALPLPQRAVAMTQLLRDEAQVAFRTWPTLPGKTPY